MLVNILLKNIRVPPHLRVHAYGAMNHLDVRNLHQKGYLVSTKQPKERSKVPVLTARNDVTFERVRPIKMRFQRIALTPG